LTFFVGAVTQIMDKHVRRVLWGKGKPGLVLVTSSTLSRIIVCSIARVLLQH